MSEAVAEATHKVPEVIGQTYTYQIGDYEVLVMVWDSGTVRTAVRKHSYQTWSPPITPIRTGKF